jgi:NADH-quinone oxidoreductase subunit B
MHGILRLRSMIQDDPAMSWRSRYAAEGTEETLAEPAGA